LRVDEGTGVDFEGGCATAHETGNLEQKFDVLVFVDGAIPGAGGGRRGGGGGADAEIPNLPAEYQGQDGRVTAERTLPKVREFIEKGGTVIAIGSSSRKARRCRARNCTSRDPCSPRASTSRIRSRTE